VAEAALVATVSVTCAEMVGQVCGTHGNVGVCHEVGHSHILIIIELPILLEKAAGKLVGLLTNNQLI